MNTAVAGKEAAVIPASQGNPLRVMGHEVTEKITSDSTNGDYYVFEVVSPPGLGIPPHVHHNEDEIIFVAEGTYEVFLGGQTYRVQPGAWLHFARNVPHGFQNVGKKPGRTLWTISPGAGFENFFAELGALPANQPPDMAKVAEIFSRYDIEILPPAAA